MKMTHAAQAAVFMGAHCYTGLRLIALAAVSQYAKAIGEGWTPDDEDAAHILKICTRFKVGAVFRAICQGYKMDAKARLA